jgi:hypothetical protein
MQDEDTTTTSSMKFKRGKKDEDDFTGPTKIIPANPLSAHSLRHRHPTLELANYQRSSTLPLGCYTKSAN